MSYFIQKAGVTSELRKMRALTCEASQKAPPLS